MSVDRTWIVVAHRAGVRIFKKNARNPTELVQTIPFAKGRLQNRELNSDRPGRTFNSVGPVRHGYESPNEPEEKLEIDLATTIAHLLDDARKKMDFQNLVLVAGPSMLGMIRNCLNQETSKLVSKTVNKNLAYVAGQELIDQLDQIMEEGKEEVA